MDAAKLLGVAVEPVAGAEFAGHLLLDELGHGGMGVVFSASHLASKRIVALKRPHAGADPALLARFRGEAMAAAALDHPHVLPIHEVGESGGVPFFTMRFAECGSLAERAHAFQNRPREAAELIAKVADALQHAHERGLLHRDVKPSNILLAASGEPLLGDFGLARWLGRDSALTLAGSVLGTPSYLAPELLGKKAEATTASDIFGLGAVLFHLLAGHAPFDGATIAETLAQATAAESISLPAGGPRDLAAICAKCLDREPARRYATAAVLAADLRNFLAGQPTLARPASSAESAWRWCRRRPTIAALLALLAVVGTLAFLLIDRARRAAAGAKERAESASTQLRETNARLADSLDTAELDRAENLFRAGESAGALALLARVARRSPMHPVAAALWHGDFALPVLPLFRGGGYVLRMRFLRDGKTLLIFHDRGIATWDAASGRRLVEFAHDGSPLARIALSPDEATLIAWHDKPGGELRIFDVRTGRLRAPPLQHAAWLHTVSFSPDGATFVTAGEGPSARFFESATGAGAGRPLAHENDL